MFKPMSFFPARFCQILLLQISLLSSLSQASWAAPAPSGGKAPAAKTVSKDEKTSKPAVNPEPVLDNLQNVTAEDLVNKPQEFLNKNVKFNANFFAFSSLALDYKPAYRSSKTHLSFLILRPSSHVPLSELKLAMMIPKDKDPENTLLATLKDGDSLEIVGKVYSTALDDPWVEVYKVKKLGGSSDKDNTETAHAKSDDKAAKSDDKAAKSDDKAGKESDKDASNSKP